MFIDIAEIEVKAGNGGSGLLSFHRESIVPKAGLTGETAVAGEMYILSQMRSYIL